MSAIVEDIFLKEYKIYFLDYTYEMIIYQIYSFLITQIKFLFKINHFKKTGRYPMNFCKIIILEII
ncbi:MAG: hypothetical protein CK427_16750 [Leptospira sp.]|nr:MAG: hypothetical protein CK427_16750 [Leptospira sp.]